jgi:hypothetical protein
MKKVYLRIGRKRYSPTDILTVIVGVALMSGIGLFLMCWFMGVIRE